MLQSHGEFIAGHICSEAQEGGPIALVENGDRIVTDAPNRHIELVVDPGILSARRRRWQTPPLKKRRGTLHRYRKNARPASQR
jgi:dihydroxy-acid dehydratase